MLETPRKVKNIFLNNSYNKIANGTIYLTMKLILNNTQSRKEICAIYDEALFPYLANI